MVQALLLNSATNIKNSELKSSTSELSTDNELSQDQQSFSKVLEDSIDGDLSTKQIVDKESDVAENAENSEAVEFIEVSDGVENIEEIVNFEDIVNSEVSVNFEESVNSEDIVNSEDNVNSEYVVNSEDIINSEEVSSIEMDNTITFDGVDQRSLDSEADLSEVDSNDYQNINNSDLEVDPLLSNIQAAQKVDTSVKITATNVASADDEINTQMNIEATSNNGVINKANSNATVSTSEQIKSEPSNNSIEQTDEDVDTSSNTTKEGETVATQKNEKTETLTTMLKTEGVAATQVAADVNGSKPIQTNQLQTDKLVAVNQQAQATNNLLDEPLDIQSKQAASLMGEKVMMMISQGKQEVQIRLDPAELGSMFIKVQVQQDQVQLNIQTQASLSKDIIEQNMPRLREQLAQQGMQLGEANVEQQSRQSQQQQQNNALANTREGHTGNKLNGNEETQTAAWIPSKIASQEQGIDYYA